MAPRPLVHVLGLCNVVAGALLVVAPGAIAPLDGASSPAARLLGLSAAVLLWAVAVGGWQLPRTASRPYLWIFGVVVKAIAAAMWGAAAVLAGVPMLWLGAVADLAVAAVIISGLRGEAWSGRRLGTPG